MKAAQPGQKERELAAVADYVFRKNNAQGVGYFALVATGKNAHYPHYHGGESVLQDGDLVLFDYAPDVANYTSDVTRMFPANGRFTPWQREIYTRLPALLPRADGGAEAGPDGAPGARRGVREDGARSSTARSFADPKVAEAARRAFIALFGPERRAERVGHWVGMEVHDVDADPEGDVLQPGMVFTIEPALTIPEDRVYVRLEDVIVDHRDRLREPVRVAALRDRRHRSDDGGAGHRRRVASVEAIDPSVHHHVPTRSNHEPSSARCPPSRSPRPSPHPPWRNPPSMRPRRPRSNASR